MNSTQLDMRRPIHNALRAEMAETLAILGRADALDDADTGAAVARVRALLAICDADPGLRADGLRTAIGTFEALAARVDAAHTTARVEAVAELYQALARFVTTAFDHMDEGRSGVERASPAAMAASQLAGAMHWIAPHVTPFERAVAMGQLQQHMPADEFSRLLDQVRPRLSPRDWDKLMHALAPLARAA